MTSEIASRVTHQELSADALSKLTGETMAAWIDDYPVSRCTATRVVSAPDGMINVRCDGQVGHAGRRHQALVDGTEIVWPNGPVLVQTG